MGAGAFAMHVGAPRAEQPVRFSSMSPGLNAFSGPPQGATHGQQPAGIVPANMAAEQGAHAATPKKPSHAPRTAGPEVGNSPNLTWSVQNNSGYIPLDADNDNGSAVTNEVPAEIDYKSNLGFAGAPDFISATIDSYPQGTGGYFSWDFTPSNGQSTGLIGLWQGGGRHGPLAPGQHYPEGQWPTTFYLQGDQPSAFVGDITITISYTYGSTTTSQGKVLTVTPVINSFHITPGVVAWYTDQGGAVSGLLTTGATNPVSGGQAGAVFQAQAVVNGLSGHMVFIQLMTPVINGVGGQHAALSFVGPQYWNWAAAPGRSFPFLDQVNAPPFAAYDVHATDTTNGGVETLTADDSPAYVNIGAFNQVTGIGYTKNFYLWLLWQFPNVNGVTTLYPLAYTGWDVTFGATNYVPGQGVTTIPSWAGVFANAGYTAANLVYPKTVGPLANDSIVLVQAS